VFRNRLINYSRYLSKDKSKLNQLDASFLPYNTYKKERKKGLVHNLSSKYSVADALIINIMGKKQCESYQKYGSFNETDLMIMRSLCKVPYFDVDKYSEVNHLMISLKKVQYEGIVYHF
jgi:hypothetical protein